MFGGNVQEEGGNGRVAEAEAAPKGYPPHQVDYDDYPAQPQYRVTLPRHSNFFADYPRKWTWDSWARRVEHESLILARGMDAVLWGTIGALLGLAASGLPGIGISGYQFVVWQPLGAVLGALAGALITWRRWRSIFRSHQDLSR